MKKFFIGVVVILISIFACKNVFADDGEIKIGLFFNMREKSVREEYHKFSLSSKDGFIINKYWGDKLKFSIDFKGETMNVQKTNMKGRIVIYDEDSKVLITRKNEQVEIIPKNNIFRINQDKAYRGSLVLRNNENDKFVLVNKLGLEEYLYGVVVKEIGDEAPMEALKAQAVAARTYAISHRNMFLKYGFDITDKYQQVYGGYLAEKKKVNLAVDETKGLVMFYNDKPIKAFYSASSGGMTEGAENVWEKEEPYLVSVLDEYDLKRKESSKWMVEFKKDEIENELNNKDVHIGELMDIEVVERSKSRRVIELKFVGSLATYTVTKNNVRTPLGLKSQLFWIEKENDIYRFYGKGFGHGVGLSQVGAMGMADSGFDFSQILKHYFTGIDIKKI